MAGESSSQSRASRTHTHTPSNSGHAASSTNAAATNADDEASARKARRQKRREEQAYKIQGWEDLYGGGGRKPVFRIDDIRRSRRSASSELQPGVSSSSSLNDAVASSSRLPPSTAPQLSSTKPTQQRGGKRKATSPPAEPRSERRRAPPVTTQPAPADPDSDDGFEIVSVAGPVASQSRMLSDRATPSDTKLEPNLTPSPDKGLRRSNLNQIFLTDASPSHQPSVTPTESAPIASSSRETSTSTSSDAASAKETKEIVLKAFIEGSSLIDQVLRAVRRFSDSLKHDHPYREAADTLERKLVALGPEPTVRDIQSASSSVPSRLAKRLAPVFRAWHSFLLRRHSESRASRSPGPALSGANAPPLASAQQPPITSEAMQEGTKKLTHEPAQEATHEADASLPTAPASTTAPAASSPASASDQVAAPPVEAPFGEQPGPGQSSSLDSPTQQEIAFDGQPAEDQEEQPTNVRDISGANAGPVSSAASAGSPQEYGTPLQELDEEQDELVDGDADPAGGEDHSHPTAPPEAAADQGRAGDQEVRNEQEHDLGVEPDDADPVTARKEPDPITKTVTDQRSADNAPPGRSRTPLSPVAGAATEQAQTQDDRMEVSVDESAMPPLKQPQAKVVADADASSEQADVIPSDAGSLVDATKQAPGLHDPHAAEPLPAGDQFQTNTLDLEALRSDGANGVMPGTADDANAATSAPAVPLDNVSITGAPGSEHLQPASLQARDQGDSDSSAGLTASSHLFAALDALDRADDPDRAVDSIADAETSAAPETLVLQADQSNAMPHGSEEPPPEPAIVVPDDVSPGADAGTEGQLASGPAQGLQRRERALSQAGSDTSAASKAKLTMADRMKSLLKELGSVSQRRSSYETLQKLKPKRAGLATPRTVPDLVEHWQDPAQMIPWTCLEEVGPEILHMRAPTHMALSMHELMDRVGNTRSVQHLSQKIPERVLARALMEFPRIPHMLHCWSAEKHKYFASRNMPPPMDTRPEFRYADADAAAVPVTAGSGSSWPETARSPEPLSSPSTPLVSIAQDIKPALMAQAVAAPSGSATTMSAPQAITSAAPQAVVLNGGPVTVPSQSNTVGQPARTVQLQPLPRTVAAPPAAIVPTQAQLAGAAAARLFAPRRSLQAPQSSAQAVGPGRPVYFLSGATNVQRAQALPQMVQARPMHAPQHHVASAPVRPRLDVNQFLRQQQEAQSAARARQLAAGALRRATEAVFAGLVADCVSFAEHMICSRATKEVANRPHFSEPDVTHVVDYVVEVYQREVEAERAQGRANGAAESKYAKMVTVQRAAMDVIQMTKILMGIRMCLSETASEALQGSAGMASARDWQEVLVTSPKYVSIVQFLMRGEEVPVGLLTRQERNVMLHTKVVALNKELERLLEKMVEVDDLVGPWEGSGVGDDDVEAIRRECFLVAGICCKHVVGILGQTGQAR